jgi:hypothetical protein
MLTATSLLLLLLPLPLLRVHDQTYPPTLLNDFT